MGAKIKLGVVAAASAILFAAGAQAHVTVTPKQSRKAVQETYTFNVPTEGTSPTTSVEINLPAGVEPIEAGAPSPAYTAVREGGRIIALKWVLDVPPGQARQLVVVAKNPPLAGRLQWKVRQGFADGTSADWVEEPGSRRPAPLTELTD